MRSTTTTGRHAVVAHNVPFTVKSVSMAFNARMDAHNHSLKRGQEVARAIEAFCQNNAGKYAVVGGDTFKMADWEAVCRISRQFFFDNADVWMAGDMALAYAFQDAENVRVDPDYHWKEWLAEMECKTMGLS